MIFMQKILWLASWYPSNLAPFDGDFIQRHARAVSLYHDVEVIFLIRDKTGKITRSVKVDTLNEGRLSQQIIYYYSPKFWLSSFDKLYSQFRYKRLLKRHIRQYIEKVGKPSLIHVHVGMKAGVIMQWIKRRYSIPYVVTEHWTGFLPEADKRFDHLNYYLQSNWQKLWKNAAGISVVSEYLKKYIEKLFKKTTKLTVIPNVVDTSIFYPGDGLLHTRPHFIHISGLNFQKNPEAILEAFHLLLKKNIDFHLDIFGPADESIFSIARRLDLQNHVSFHPEVAQAVLAGYVRRADALVLYSRYETFGCVVIEALASGVPVIVSDIPVMRELVVENHNGLLAIEGSAEALAETLEKYLQNKVVFDKKKIADECAAKYNYAVVGKLFADWYKLVLMEKG